MTAFRKQFRLDVSILERKARTSELNHDILLLYEHNIWMMDLEGGPCEKPSHEDLWGQRNDNAPQSAWFEAHAEIEGSGL